MYNNDGCNKIIIEKKKNLFTKIFSSNKKKNSSKKDTTGIQYIVPYSSAPYIVSSKQVSQNSLNDFCNTPKFENSDNVNYNVYAETSPCLSTDTITEKRNNEIYQKGSNTNNKYDINNSYYLNSVVVYNNINGKCRSSSDNFKNYLKCLAHSKKHQKPFISVTTTSSSALMTSSSTYNSKDSNTLPNISNVSSSYSIAIPNYNTHSQMHSSMMSKDDISLPKCSTDRKLALDKIITKLRKVQKQQQQQQQQSEIENDDEYNDYQCKEQFNEINKYKSKNYKSNDKYNSSSLSISNNDLVSKQCYNTLPSNYSKIASIDYSNGHLNDENNIKNTITKPVHVYGSGSGNEINFNSDETLMGSQCNSQSLYSQNNIGSSVIDSNVTIQQENSDSSDEIEELKRSLNQMGIQSSTTGYAGSRNPILQKKSSSHSNNYLSPKLANSSSISPARSMEIHRSKTISISGVSLARHKRDLSSDNYESTSYGCSPSALHIIRASTYNLAAKKSFTSHKKQLSCDSKSHMSQLNRVNMIEDVIEEQGDEENDTNGSMKQEKNSEKDKSISSFIKPRKPKTLFNEKNFSNPFANQAQNELKMETNPFKYKRRIFSNIIRDRDIYVRDGRKMSVNELSINNNNNNTMGKARRVSVSAGNYYHTKETDSIYLKSDEQYNVSLPSLNGKIEGKVNQYYIIKEIDSGSYGRVYLVYDEIINKYFACKMISKSRLKRNFRLSRLARRRNITGEEEEQYDPEEHLLQIKKEVAILKNLTKHPNIVLLVEVLNDTREDNIYLVFELCEKGKLMDIQINKKAEPYTEEKARKYFRDVVLGLEYCHFKKIIHRDIKPDNILVTADDNIKISDFGISYIFNEDQEDATISNKNASPLYLPPEACSSDVPYMKGKAMDIWSLGVTLYALVHGYCPFEDADVINLYKKIENDPVVYSPTISEDLKDLLSKLLQKDPEKRITIQEIKRHPWVTEHDTNPMLSTEENCIYEDITDEEIENSIQPGFMFVSKLLNRIKKGLSKSDENKRSILKI